MIHILLLLSWIPSFLAPSLPAHKTVQAEPAVVRAVLFYSPSCGHCHYVITEVLPGLFEKYGEQLEIIGVDASTEGGQILFQSAMQFLQLEQAGVPFLVVGERVLIGSVDIPNLFPQWIEEHLAQGGVDWPKIPGLAEAMATSVEPESAPAESNESPAQTAAQPQPAESAEVEEDSNRAILGKEQALAVNLETGVLDHLRGDPVGNSLAVAVLAGMLFSTAGVGLYFKGTFELPAWENSQWLIPVLCNLGIGIAGYLSYVETNQIEAVCGPIGDCNTVQQSDYARLFGVLPVGILGVGGYLLILAAWAAKRFGAGRQGETADLILFGMTVIGVAFSIYFTYLEPFVIGAVCAWCLTSAVIMAVLLWLTAPPAKRALQSNL